MKRRHSGTTSREVSPATGSLSLHMLSSGGITITALPGLTKTIQGYKNTYQRSGHRTSRSVGMVPMYPCPIPVGLQYWTAALEVRMYLPVMNL